MGSVRLSCFRIRVNALRLGWVFLAVLLVILASPTIYSGDLGLTQAKTCKGSCKRKLVSIQWKAYRVQVRKPRHTM